MSHGRSIAISIRFSSDVKHNLTFVLFHGTAAAENLKPPAFVPPFSPDVLTQHVVREQCRLEEGAKSRSAGEALLGILSIISRHSDSLFSAVYLHEFVYG